MLYDANLCWTCVFQEQSRRYFLGKDATFEGRRLRLLYHKTLACGTGNSNKEFYVAYYKYSIL